MNAIGVIAILLLLLAGMSYSQGENNLALNYFEIAAFLGIVSVFLQKEENRSNDFLIWVVNNINSIKNGTAMFEGKPINTTTEVVQFLATFSFIVITTKSPSRYFIRGQDNLFGYGLAYTLITFMLGWWGLPWGPVYTLESLYRNIRGGHKKMVGELIHDIEKASVVATQKEGAIHPT